MVERLRYVGRGRGETHLGTLISVCGREERTEGGPWVAWLRFACLFNVVLVDYLIDVWVMSPCYFSSDADSSQCGLHPLCHSQRSENAWIQEQKENSEVEKL